VRIVQLTAENLKRLKAVEITPTGDVVIVSGKNGAGKTSVLDAIWFALGGKDAQKGTSKPVREGAEQATVTLDLGDITVTRTWTAKGKSTLTVTGADGARFASPQTMLDSLVGRLSFDPLEFAQLSEKEQLRVLLDLLELPVKPEELDAQRKQAFDRRTEINRVVKQLEAELKAVPDLPDGVPDEEVSAQEILAEVRAAEGWQRTALNLQQEREQSTLRIKQLQEQLALEEERLLGIDADIANLPTPLPDPQDALARLQTVEDTNRWVRVKANRNRVQEALNLQTAESTRLTQYLEEVDSYKASVIAAAKMPIAGLGFDEDGVTYQDVPFKQASAAEQLRVSVAMAMALNPQIRVVRITDGSLLDNDNLQLITDMAAANDMQVWIERVSDTGDVGIVIEDGQVKA
jgi:DNA repair exonuclease SbcCD ATPase subunit